MVTLSAHCKGVSVVFSELANVQQTLTRRLQEGLQRYRDHSTAIQEYSSTVDAITRRVESSTTASMDLEKSRDNLMTELTNMRCDKSCQYA